MRTYGHVYMYIQETQRAAPIASCGSVYIYIYIYICMYACVYVCMYVCIYAYVGIYNMCMHARTHTHRSLALHIHESYPLYSSTRVTSQSLALHIHESYPLYRSTRVTSYCIAAQESHPNVFQHCHIPISYTRVSCICIAAQESHPNVSMHKCEKRMHSSRLDIIRGELILSLTSV